MTTFSKERVFAPAVLPEIPAKIGRACFDWVASLTRTVTMLLPSRSPMMVASPASAWANPQTARPSSRTLITARARCDRTRERTTLSAVVAGIMRIGTSLGLCCLRLARRVKQAPDGHNFAKLVESLHGSLGLKDFGFDARFGQGLQGLGRDPKPLPHAARKHHGLGAVHDQFVDIGGLNARHMPGSGLAPIPLAGAAGKNLRVLECRKTLDLDAAPGKLHNARGFRLRLAHIRSPQTKRESPVIVTRASPVMRFPSCFSRESTERRAHESGNSRARLRQEKICSGCCPNITLAPGARFAAKLPKRSAVDVSRARPFHAMVASKFASRPDERKRQA